MIKYFIIIILIGVIFLSVPKLSTKTEFSLTKLEYKEYKKRAINGDLDAIDTLYKYYFYSLNDYNKSIQILRDSAKLNDARSQYRLSLYFLRDYYPYGIKESFKGEGLYWLEKSANQNYQEAVNELKERQINSF